MSSAANNFNQKTSASASTRRRSATVSLPATDIPKSNVHVSVSVSLSESLASISAWASQIVPGAPPTSPSPRRSSFYSVSSKTPARSPKTSRRNSVSATFRAFWESPSTIPQTPAPKPVSPADLLAQGYTSIFVHLPRSHRDSEYPDSIPEPPSPKNKSTITPLFLPHAQPSSRTKSVSAEKGEDKPSSLTRLRSFSLKAKKQKASTAMGGFNPPTMLPLPSHKSSAHSHAPRQSKKPKSTPQSRYGAILGPRGGTGALPLAQEVALAQMLDGGSRDTNVRRVTERHARATGMHAKSSARDEAFKKSRKDRRPIEKREGLEQDVKVGSGVSGIYSDHHGNLWWDEDESLELAGLLPTSDAQPHPQNGQMPLSGSSIHNQEKERRRRLLPRLMTSAKPPPAGTIPAPPAWEPMHSPVASKAGRKGSASDASSPETDDDPDLDPSYAVRPRDSSALFAGYSLTAERERHLRRTPQGIEAFGISPLDTPGTATNGHARPEKREKKRPAPLALPLSLPTPQAPTSGSAATTKTMSRPPTAFRSPPPLPPLDVLNGPTKEEREGRKEFFASAFAPAPVQHSSAPHNSTAASLTSHAEVKAARRSSLLGLPAFGGSGRTGRRTSVASASPTSPVSRAPRPNPNPNNNLAQFPNGSLKTISRPSTANGTETERSLKTKASRSRLAGLFKRN